MKYLRLAAPPAGIQEWLDQELEQRGIDAVVYTRYILSLLQLDNREIALHDDFYSPSKESMKKPCVKMGGSKKARRRQKDKVHSVEELKKSAVIDCLMSASEQNQGIENLVDELCIRLKSIHQNEDNPHMFKTSSEESGAETDGYASSSPEEQAEKYYAAFPALTVEESAAPSTASVSNSVWSLQQRRVVSEDGKVVDRLGPDFVPQHTKSPMLLVRGRGARRSPRSRKHMEAGGNDDSAVEDMGNEHSPRFGRRMRVLVEREDASEGDGYIGDSSSRESSEDRNEPKKISKDKKDLNAANERKPHGGRNQRLYERNVEDIKLKSLPKLENKTDEKVLAQLVSKFNDSVAAIWKEEQALGEQVSKIPSSLPAAVKKIVPNIGLLSTFLNPANPEAAAPKKHFNQQQNGIEVVFSFTLSNNCETSVWTASPSDLLGYPRHKFQLLENVLCSVTDEHDDVAKADDVCCCHDDGTSGDDNNNIEQLCKLDNEEPKKDDNNDVNETATEQQHDDKELEKRLKAIWDDGGEKKEEDSVVKSSPLSLGCFWQIIPCEDKLEEEGADLASDSEYPQLLKLVCDVTEDQRDVATETTSHKVALDDHSRKSLSLNTLNHLPGESDFKEVVTIVKDKDISKSGFQSQKTILARSYAEEEDLLTSPHTHFRPINHDVKDNPYSDDLYEDGTTFNITHETDNPVFFRSKSGAFYLESDIISGDTPDKYMVYQGHTEGDIEKDCPLLSDSSFEENKEYIVKFKVKNSTKFCQTDPLEESQNAESHPQVVESMPSAAAEVDVSPVCTEAVSPLVAYPTLLSEQPLSSYGLPLLDSTTEVDKHPQISQFEETWSSLKVADETHWVSEPSAFSATKFVDHFGECSEVWPKHSPLEHTKKFDPVVCMSNVQHCYKPMSTDTLTFASSRTTASYTRSNEQFEQGSSPYTFSPSSHTKFLNDDCDTGCGSSHYLAPAEYCSWTVDSRDTSFRPSRPWPPQTTGTKLWSSDVVSPFQYSSPQNFTSPQVSRSVGGKGCYPTWSHQSLAMSPGSPFGTQAALSWGKSEGVYSRLKAEIHADGEELLTDLHHWQQGDQWEDEETVAVSQEDTSKHAATKGYEKNETVPRFLDTEHVHFSTELEEEWKQHGKPFNVQVPKRDKFRRKRLPTSKRPCSFYLEGNCRHKPCRFSHDLASITCRFWEDGMCFKDITCPFLHGYPSELDTSDGDGERTLNYSMGEELHRSQVLAPRKNFSGGVRMKKRKFVRIPVRDSRKTFRQPEGGIRVVSQEEPGP